MVDNNGKSTYSHSRASRSKSNSEYTAKKEKKSVGYLVSEGSIETENVKVLDTGTSGRGWVVGGGGWVALGKVKRETLYHSTVVVLRDIGVGEET